MHIVWRRFGNIAMADKARAFRSGKGEQVCLAVAALAVLMHIVRGSCGYIAVANGAAFSRRYRLKRVGTVTCRAHHMPGRCIIPRDVSRGFGMAELAGSLFANENKAASVHFCFFMTVSTYKMHLRRVCCVAGHVTHVVMAAKAIAAFRNSGGAVRVMALKALLGMEVSTVLEHLVAGLVATAAFSAGRSPGVLRMALCTPLVLRRQFRIFKSIALLSVAGCTDFVSSETEIS